MAATTTEKKSTWMGRKRWDIEKLQRTTLEAKFWLPWERTNVADLPEPYVNHGVSGVREGMHRELDKVGFNDTARAL
jgi:hypothetical protein